MEKGQISTETTKRVNCINCDAFEIAITEWELPFVLMIEKEGWQHINGKWYCPECKNTFSQRHT